MLCTLLHFLKKSSIGPLRFGMDFTGGSDLDFTGGSDLYFGARRGQLKTNSPLASQISNPHSSTQGFVGDPQRHSLGSRFKR